MNTRERNRMNRLNQRASESMEVLFQTAEGESIPEPSEFVTKHTGTFSIKVTSDEVDPATKEKKVLYSNEEESFTYEQVDSVLNVFRNEGAKLDDSQIEFLDSVFGITTDAEGNETEASKSIGKAVKSITSMYNSKLKADAKSSAYASLVNKYKPLEGEKKESAQARLVANFIKLAGVSKETAIENLKIAKALPSDYTVADFDSTPLRRTKAEED